MALEAVVFPQDFLGCTLKDLYNFGGKEGVWTSYDFGEVVKEVDGVLGENFGEWGMNLLSSTEAGGSSGGAGGREEEKVTVVATGRRKRRRTKSCKNKEDVENQRMTHIAVERNRRKQMNEYLGVLRSIMPQSYVQRGDQASIIGGAINFVKELEQLLQSLEARRRIKQQADHPGDSTISSPFADFFSFPQYSSSSSQTNNATAAAMAATNTTTTSNETMIKDHSSVADVEVTMVESHANLRVLSKRQPKQLLKMVVGLQNLRLTTLHLNVTTMDQMVLYSFSLKVEEDCRLTSVDEIATAVYRMVEKIQGEAGFN